MYVGMCLCVNMICTYTRARTHTHTQSHTHTLTHTHTHTQTQIGRPLGLSSSLPAAMWQELRKAGSGTGFMGLTGGGSSHGTTGHVTSHGTSAAHTPYAHTPYTHSHYSASSGGNTGNTGYNSNPFTAASHFSSASELSYGERDGRYLSLTTGRSGLSVGDSRERDMGDSRSRDIRELMPSEVAHLQRVARLDAKLGYYRDTAGTWHHKAPSHTHANQPSVDVATVLTYGQDLCTSKATRKRYRLDAIHAKVHIRTRFRYRDSI